MAGRTKKIVTEESTLKETKPKTTSKANSKKSDAEKENQQLKEQILQLQKMMETLLSNSNTPQNIETTEIENPILQPESEEFEDVRPDKQISVMSLENNEMYLTTMQKGQGKQFPFYKFGQVRNINYSDLSDLILNHQQFAEDGRFYILDRNAVHKQGLDDAYKNILNKDQLSNILKYTKDQISDLLDKASKPQQETIISLLIERISKGEELDFNKVNFIGKLLNKDITALASSASYNYEE